MRDGMKRTIAGFLPSDWDAELIKSVCKVVRGASPRPAGDPKFFNGNYLPWITVADITGTPGMYLKSTRSKLTKEGAKFTRVIEPGTLIISNSGATLGVPKISMIVAGANDGIAMFLEPRKLLKEYMYFFLQAKTAFFRNELAPGMGQPNLNTELLGDVAIPIPPIEDQRCIALLLSIWDKAVEKAERLIAAKERQYTAQARKFLFGGSLQSHNDLNRARWFSVPSHWKIVKIGSVAAEVKRTNSAGEDIPVLSCTKYNGLVDSLSYFGKQVFSLDTSAYKVVQNGEFAYATNHIEEGSIGYQNLYDKGLVSPMYTVFKTNLAIHDGYLFKVLKTETYRHIFQVNTSASVDRRGSLRWKEFARLPLPLPPIEEQKQISETLDIAQREIDLLKKQAEAYRRQKRGLMQKLLTGEWQINGGLDNHEPGTD